MHKTLIPLSFDKIMQTRSYTMIVMQGQGKRFAIYTDPSIGKTLQLYLTNKEPLRPLTHDLISSIFEGLDITLKQVVIVDLQDTIYFSRLFLEQMHDDIRHIVEIDARPSDAVTLALMHNAPVFCTEEVLEHSMPLEDF
jgi:uncharacterized protein